MIRELINRYEKIIINSYLARILNIYDNDKIIMVEDSRSAAFYCLGINQKKEGSALLITDDTGVLSCYTTLTESYFQKVKLDVVVIGHGTIPTLFKECSAICENIDDLGRKTDKVNSILPIKNDNNVKYGKTNITIEALIKKYKHIHFKVSNKLNTKEDGCTKLESEIGMITRYIGGLQINKSVLICFNDEFSYEINTINLRYINSSFKVIVINENGTPIMEEWLFENKITLFRGRDEFDKFMDSKKPAVLVLKGE